MIHLEDITEVNWRISLSVSKEQEAFVSNPMKLLARAYAFRNLGSYACIICNDDEPIGMALYHECPELNAYDLSQLFIDERYQGKGYGKEAAKLLIEQMRAKRKYDKIVLCYIEGNDAARLMYESIGFRHTGEADEDEIMMELYLAQNDEA